MIRLTTLSLLAILPAMTIAEEPHRLGTVDFAFDGGTLMCEFGAIDRDTKPHLALIVHPTSAKTKLKRLGIVRNENATSSTVLITGPGGKYQLLDRDAAKGWAKQRIADMSARPSSPAENAFVATVLYTVTTGDPIRVWANDGVTLLRSGKWSGLFNPAPTPPDDFPKSDPFADPDDCR